MRTPGQHSHVLESTGEHESLTFLAIPLLALALLLASGCTGLTQASSVAAKSSSASNSSGGTSPSSLTASQTSLNFSGVDIGTKKSLPVVLTNTGSSEVAIANVTISGAGYTAGGLQSGQILGPGELATLTVTFDPAATGALAGHVTVTGTAANSSIAITLAGTGMQPPAAHTATLSWTASTSSISGYNVYRSSVSGGPYTKLTQAPETATSSTDTAVVAGETYYYVVTSLESSGVESSYSNEVSAAIPSQE